MIRKGIGAVLLCAGGGILSTGCTAARHAADTQDGLHGDRLTVGTLHKEIQTGMSGGDVAQTLGSPNIVTTDEHGRDVWISDNIATDRVSSEGAGGGTLILLWGQQRAGASSTSQRTLTVIIKFDHEQKVRDFAYHASRF